ncbi:S-adenosylmethionine:tRNA ribosyltransferase-isomerase, partial [Listeria monocytogenes]|uniref:S-adenosylmethionine:tRNA ribosyltransferase-isomerase n=1 Tax=Listeria monocytogenes TaxID=1639 RepID=UPI001C44D952|nr:S-adenosylmethionine:tRNA ribosyltransferase-isomerase [Listeria monocytogenes]
MNIEEFDYDLPESLIAQTPLKDRDHSRLLVMDSEMKHLHFKDIIEYFKPGDTLVLNDTRV